MSADLSGRVLDDAYRGPWPEMRREKLRVTTWGGGEDRGILPQAWEVGV